MNHTDDFVKEQIVKELEKLVVPTAEKRHYAIISGHHTFGCSLLGLATMPILAFNKAHALLLANKALCIKRDFFNSLFDAAAYSIENQNLKVEDLEHYVKLMVDNMIEIAFEENYLYLMEVTPLQ